MTLTKRDKSIDFTKGFLIICLVLHHIIDYSQNYFNINNSLLLVLKECQRPLFLCYFMQCFFFITGFCSNFESKPTTFIVKQIKTLLIPNIVFMLIYCIIHRNFSTIFCDFILYGGYLWFLTSLFTCKCVFYFLQKIKSYRYIFLICVMFSLLGTLLNEVDIIPNYWWHKQSLDLLLFLAIGYFMKKNNLNNKWITSTLYIVTISLLFLYNIKIPHVTAGFNTTLFTWIPHIILSITGSITIINICKHINNSYFLEYLGKNSLTIYMWHSEILLILLDTFSYVLIEDKLGHSIITILTIWITTIVIAITLGWFMNRKYLKWSLGKF